MYALKISTGYVTIRPADLAACELWLNDRRICECESASAAAQLVALKRTGSRDIDGESSSLPSDIEGWHWVSVYLSRRSPVEGSAK